MNMNMMCTRCKKRMAVVYLSYGDKTGQSQGNHSADGKQRGRQPEDVQSGIFLFHAFFASFTFLGAPNLVGRPIRSSSTTQQFMIRMA